MPIVEWIRGKFILKCVNFHGTEYMPPAVYVPDEKTGEYTPPKTTMEAVERNGVLPVTTYTMQEDDIVPQHHIETTNGLPVKIFACKICGYVEIYASAASDTAGLLPHG